MCGILSIVAKDKAMKAASLAEACSIIRHRGPDDEGFLTWNRGDDPVLWAGDDTAASTLQHLHYQHLPQDHTFQVGFGHRRLSILDLSPAGHQPMLYHNAGLAITFNGEVYNYLEIREELVALGHSFVSTSDTEVILHAWAQWGEKCIDRFNGMFAFVILDYKNNQLYAVRDRFGVKPLYYYDNGEALYLTSELKQIRTDPQYKLSLNETLVRQYLVTGAINHTQATFDTNIHALPPGHLLHINLSAASTSFAVKAWYTLQPRKWSGTFDEAIAEFRRLLIDAVRLRLRSDVTVGSCLSGGLDSSSIVCIAADLLKAGGDNAGQETVTACYENARFDEWKFALEVINKTNARPHRTFPSFNQLVQEIDDFLWHQDEPTGSTSQFSQWAVFKATHDAGLKVMVDGQGADEQLAGYGGNDLPLYAGYAGSGNWGRLLDEMKHYKQQNGNWPIGFVAGGIQLGIGGLMAALLPSRLKLKPVPNALWLSQPEPSSIYSQPARSLQENLLRQMNGEPLPALLRYEDRNSMAWSVESRTPFMDYRLVEFTLGLPPEYIYLRGERKTILRRAMQGILPPAIENRKDKMGFVTPEELWLREEGKEWFLKGVNKTLELFPHLFNKERTLQMFDDMASGKTRFDFTIWRILALGRWYSNLNNSTHVDAISKVG